jgi:hypothetical protein
MLAGSTELSTSRLPVSSERAGIIIFESCAVKFRRVEEKSKEIQGVWRVERVDSARIGRVG